MMACTKTDVNGLHPDTTCHHLKKEKERQRHDFICHNNDPGNRQQDSSFGEAVFSDQSLAVFLFFFLFLFFLCFSGRLLAPLLARFLAFSRNSRNLPSSAWCRIACSSSHHQVYAAPRMNADAALHVKSPTERKYRMYTSNSTTCYRKLQPPQLLQTTQY